MKDKVLFSVLGATLVLGMAVAGATEYDITLDGMPRDLTVQHTGAPDVPTVYIVGLPDVSGEEVRWTKGLTLNGIRLTERLLSESVLILYAGGGGKWGYNTGFDIFRGPHFQDGRVADPRSTVEYGKVRYDPLDRVSTVGGDMNQLALFNHRPLTPLRYHIAFPDPIRIRTLSINSNCDRISTDGVEVTLTLYADMERREVIAQRVIGGTKGRFPVVFDGLDSHSIVFEMSASAPQGLVGFYYTRLEADLDTGDLALPVLENGANVITVSDDEDSSHRARIVLRWLDNKPAGDAVFDDFEEDLKWSAGVTRVEGSWENGFAFTGGGFGRLEFPAMGRDHSFSRGISPAVDLSAFNRLGIATRVYRGAPMTAVLVGLRHAEDGWSPWLGRLQPGERWNYQTLDISKIRRDSVTGIRIYFVATRGYDRPDSPCLYDIDTLSFFHEDEQTAAVADQALPVHVAAHKSPYAGRKPRRREAPPMQEWFPMGVYDGTTGRTREEAVWLLDQMKRLNMNTIYLSNGTLDSRGERLGLTGLLPLAEARGIRLIYQGTSPGALFSMGATREARLHNLENTILPTARKRVPEFHDSWSLAAWSLTEEIRPDHSRDLKPYYDVMRELAPQQPPTVMHNSLEAAKVDLETNKPLVITHDRYPFFWSPRSGPSNPGRSVPWYHRGIGDYYRAARQHGASLWMMPQSWGGAEKILDPPHYGYEVGMRKPEPGEIMQQGWLAVAEGATGIMYYAAISQSPDTYHLWDYGFMETQNTRAAGELFGRLRRVAPLLVRLERDYQEEGFVSVLSGRALANTFVRRDGYQGAARYVVLASLDGFDSQQVSLQIGAGERVYDMVERREIRARLDKLVLGPGEGMVLAIATRQQFRHDCRMIDEQLQKYYR